MAKDTYENIRVYFVKYNGGYVGPQILKAKTLEEMEEELPRIIKKHQDYDRYIVLGTINHGDVSICQDEIEKREETWTKKRKR